MSNPNMESQIKELLELKRMKEELEDAITAAEDAMIRNSERWPIYFPSDSWPEDEIDFEEEIDNLYVWLTERIDYLTPIFNRYLQLD